MKYPKIKSLFKRGEGFKFTGEFVSEFLSDFTDFRWVCQEKLDGMNIRIICDYENKDFKYFGRTDNAQIPEHLQPELNKIIERVKEINTSEAFPNISTFILYGEGFGHKIQKGGLYLGDKVAFNLFDCYAFIPSKKGFWLEAPRLAQLVELFKINLVPAWDAMTISEASDLVKAGFQSKYGTAKAEGLVLKTRFPLFDSFGERLIFKLKTKDF